MIVRVVRGDPDDGELAALVIALLARRSAQDAARLPAPPAGPWREPAWPGGRPGWTPGRSGAPRPVTWPAGPALPAAPGTPWRPAPSPVTTPGRRHARPRRR